MTKKKHGWFFDQPWREVERIIDESNTGVKTKKALKILHSGKTYRAAGKAGGVTFQSLFQWLNRTAERLNGKA